MAHATVDEPERGRAGRGAVDSGAGGGEGSRQQSGKRREKRAADVAEFFCSSPIMQIDWRTGGPLARWSRLEQQRLAALHSKISWNRVLLNWTLLQLLALVTVGSIRY